MKKSLHTIAMVGLIIYISLFFGCAYQVATEISPAVNIYSSYDDKIPAKVMLVLNDDIRNYHKEIKPSSYVCSFHKFPLKLDEALAVSIRQTTESIFDEVIEQNSMPNKELLEKLNCEGVVYVSLKRLYPTVRFTQGFWNTSASAYCDLVLDVTIKDGNNKILLVTNVGGDGRADGGGGAACDGGATVLGEAVFMGIRETMERFAERVSNARQIREYFDKKSNRNKSKSN